MNDREDFDLDPSGSREPLFDLEGERRSRRPVWPWLVAVAVLAIAGAIGYWWWMREPVRPSAPPAVTSPEGSPQEPAAAPEPDEVATPGLAESDAWIRAVAEQLSSHPRLASWLAHDELVRRFVAAVDNFADGISPRNHIVFAAPAEPFQVAGAGGGRVPAPAGYDRYSPMIAAVESLHVDGTADLYRRMEPLFDEAYRDLGYPDGRFADPLRRAMSRVLTAPVLDGPPELVATATGFSFADPELEALDDATKHLLRLGPDNLTILQRKVRRLAGAIGLAVGS